MNALTDPCCLPGALDFTFDNGVAGLLRQAPLFSHLADDLLAQLATQATRRTLARGELLFVEGDDADRVYLLLDGSVQFFVTDGQGRRLVNAVARAGAMPGLVSYIDCMAQECGCVSDEAALLLEFGRDMLCRFFGSVDGLPSCPRVRGELMFRLVGIIRQLTKQTRQLALMDVYTRVRLLFERMSVEEGGVCMLRKPLTQQDIADMIGASREMVARILKELVFGGYIRQENRRIIIERPLPENF
ncbi:Crp/Fnr family transcriptional regulator [Crenobacter caeni]|uniref:Crp/Fnr family transcriptional regulator n=1 Tax=Crenobacter caeni TaxID=2705474 RepID=A0A6B2KRK5_9NEIS|nr:Crp/Fnr family transcriptional regulator [Crenobacter caeni]NDV12788.1 Crp/Fnr family transcriptional regulator [Crenobacter caeni]